MRHRLWRAAVSAAAAGLALSPVMLTVAGPQAAAASCGTRHGNWRMMAAPKGLAPVGHANVDRGATYFAVDPVDPNRLYASPDKRRILRSLDGGCTWRAVFDLSSLPSQPTGSLYSLFADRYRIYEIVVPHGWSAADGRTVYALAQMPPPDSDAGTVGEYQGWPVMVAVSNDAGSTWRVPDPTPTQKMPVGAPGCSSLFPQAWLAAAPGAPATLYFMCPTGGHDDLSYVPPLTERPNTTYRSTDGGASWSTRSWGAFSMNLAGGLGPQFDVDAHNPAALYAVSMGFDGPRKKLTTVFYGSRDGGTVFDEYDAGRDGDPSNVGLSALTAAPGRARLAAFGLAGLCISTDAGEHSSCWQPPSRSGQRGIVSGAVWSAAGDKLFVTVAYDEDWQFTGCGVQRAGVLTVKRMRWHDLGRVPAPGRNANGVAISTLTADARGRGPVMVTQACERVQDPKWPWKDWGTAVAVLRYASAWA